MARVEQLPAGRVIRPETAAEIELLRHGLHQRRLVLCDAYYEVRPSFVMLPAGASEAAAVVVCRAFEESAVAHALAQEQRRRFHLET
jgi:hypothetical protein